MKYGNLKYIDQVDTQVKHSPKVQQKLWKYNDINSSTNAKP